MISIKDFLELIQYRITETSDYLWNCYGSNAMSMDSWDKKNDSYSLSIIFDKTDQTVYEMQAHDYHNGRSYRWFNPEYKEKYFEESKRHNINPNEAWDDVKYIDLETAEDMLEKAEAIFNKKDYDTRVKVPIDLSDDELFELMKRAHEQDITFNQYIINILNRFIDHTQAEYTSTNSSKSHDYD